MPEITGASRVCFVVADPVAHVRTPHALNGVWNDRGLDVVTVPAQVHPDSLRLFLEGVRANQSVVGAVVTVPHKQAVVALCDELGSNARVVGAVNVIRRESDGRLVGETFDGLGFVEGLRAAGIDPNGRRAVVLGAGGAASAVAVALLDAGAERLDVSNRTSARAQELVGRLRQSFPSHDIATGLARIPDADLVVNATSSGMSPSDLSPIEGYQLAPDAIAADVVMSAAPTPFLAAAAAQGNRIHEGSRMLAGQLKLISEFLVP